MNDLDFEWSPFWLFKHQNSLVFGFPRFYVTTTFSNFKSLNIHCEHSQYCMQLKSFTVCKMLQKSTRFGIILYLSKLWNILHILACSLAPAVIKLKTTTLKCNKKLTQMIYFLISTLVGLTETDIVIQHQNVSFFAVEYSIILKKTNLSFCDDLTKNISYTSMPRKVLFQVGGMRVSG